MPNYNILSRIRKNEIFLYDFLKKIKIIKK